MELTIQNFRNKFERKNGQRDQIINDISVSDEKISNLKDEILYTEKAQEIIAAVAKITQDELQYRITEPVSLASAIAFL